MSGNAAKYPPQSFTKRPKPLYQGDLDGLCGAYAIVNTLRYLKGSLSHEEASALLKDVLLLWECGRPQAEHILWGSVNREIVLALRRLLRPRHAVLHKKPFPKSKGLTLAEYWKSLTEFLREDGHVAILRVDGGGFSHWTLAHRTTPQTLWLYDSADWQYLRKRHCALNGSKESDGAVYRLFPSHTYFVWLSPDTFAKRKGKSCKTLNAGEDADASHSVHPDNSKNPFVPVGESGRYRASRAVTDGDILGMARSLISRKFERGASLGNPEASREFLSLHLALLEHEVFCCLFLDNQHRVLAFEPLFRGTVDGASVYPREVVKRALALNACAVIFAHNHPSGLTDPSEADKHITLLLKQALGLVGIRVLDHFIVGGDSVLSFAERGLL